MRISTKKRLILEGKTVLRPNRRQGKALPLCVCSHTKKEHYKNALGCNYKGSHTKNVVAQ
jgi:hypothetical protein